MTSEVPTAPKPAAQTPPPDFYKPGAYRADESVGYLMRRVVNSILAQGDKELAQHDLTHAQWMPLFKIALSQGGTVAHLARDLCIDPGAMTRSLDRLENKGLIERQRSLEDRRVVNLTLTPEGRQVADKVPAVMAKVLNTHLSGFNEAEWHQLTDLLQRMLANGNALRSND